MAVDTPATIAILGAGPMGLETALYARYLGYDVLVFEQGDVAAGVRQWGHVRLFTPFALNSTTLGCAAITAHDEHAELPGEDELLTGNEWFVRYLRPLSETDLISDHLYCQTRVVGVGRVGNVKSDLPGKEVREQTEFRVLTDHPTRGEEEFLADVVIDTTGVTQQPNLLGDGGLPALGERRWHEHIWRRIPDIQGADRERFIDRRTLVVGTGYSAATCVRELVALHQESGDASGQVVWCCRRPLLRGQLPLRSLADDQLSERESLTRQANEAVGLPFVELRAGKQVAAIDRRDGQLYVTLRPTPIVEVSSDDDSHDENEDEVQDVAESDDGANGASDSQVEEIVVDELIGTVGYAPDTTLFEPLHVHLCYATSGPIKLAASLLSNASDDCLQQDTGGPELLLNPEPDFYVLGSKSYGRNPQFLLANGHQQIRQVFSVIGDRQDLDLYGSFSRPVEQR